MATTGQEVLGTDNTLLEDVDVEQHHLFGLICLVSLHTIMVPEPTIVM